MDNTENINPVNVLTKTYRNIKTGETKVISKPLSPVKRVSKKVIATGKGKKTVGAILVARLQPFRFAMVEGLKRKGINTNRLAFKTIIALYYNNFCITDNSIKPLNISDFINHVAFKISPKDEVNGDISEARNLRSFQEISEIIDHIIAVFKGAKQNFYILKEQGLKPYQYLTDEELLQAKACIIVERDLINKSKYDNYVKTSDVMIWVKIVFWLVAAYYLIKSL